MVGSDIKSIVAIIGVILVVSCFTYVSPGYEGVMINKVGTGVQNDSLSPGLHFKMSLAQSVVSMETRTQKVEVTTPASSRDLQEVTSTIALNYRIVGGAAPEIYQTVGLDYVDRVVLPAVEESTKAATAQYTAAELITERPKVKADVTTNIKERLGGYNILVEQVSITNFSFSPEYSDAIEAKQIAEQQAEKATRDLDRIRIEAEQKVTQASAEANATKLQGDANAYAVRVMGDALKDNPDVASIKWIEKWNGELPFYVAGDSENLMMLNANA
ncbi:MAG: prohibitin family protein [Methanogenium sp.]